LPPRFFYDARGAHLFDAICELPEYYITRTEKAILRTIAPALAARLGPGVRLVEYGSGTGVKVLTLLRALPECACYIPVDINSRQLSEAAARLAREMPRLPIIPVSADFTQPFFLPQGSGADSRCTVAFFPGSSIGNFTPAGAIDFLGGVRDVVGKGGTLVVGVDLKKNRACLESAYNDSQGVTAAFNLNMLARINRELDGTFDLTRFRHHAFYNDRLGRIEMHLESIEPQSVTVAGRSFHWQCLETIHTENSYKYTIDEFRALAQSAGFTPGEVFTDPEGLFSIHVLDA
jgi:dimethylhistidine N-methyltransferase